MQKRYVSLWFRYLLTDWLTLRDPELKDVPVIMVSPIRNRMVITAANYISQSEGITIGMAAADAKAMLPDIKIIDDIPGKANKLLYGLGEWCIRYTPIIAIDEPDGLVMDVSGCTHLWGDERSYLKEIVTHLRSKGYYVRGAMADTVGAAWAIARYGKLEPIIEPGKHAEALMDLPPMALRLEQVTIAQLQKLGFYSIRSFINISKQALRRRFGTALLLRLRQALGTEMEPLDLIYPVEEYSERLPCLEPVRTAVAIEIAIKKLLGMLCQRLAGEGKGAQKWCSNVTGLMVR